MERTRCHPGLLAQKVNYFYRKLFSIFDLVSYVFLRFSTSQSDSDLFKKLKLVVNKSVDYYSKAGDWEHLVGGDLNSLKKFNYVFFKCASYFKTHLNVGEFMMSIDECTAITLQGCILQKCNRFGSQLLTFIQIKLIRP